MLRRPWSTTRNTWPLTIFRPHIVGQRLGCSNNNNNNDWVCGCGFRNFGFRQRCLKCDGASAVSETRPSNNNNHNNNSMSRPMYGGDAAPQPTRSPQRFMEGDWICGCSTHNFARRSSCMRCGKQRAEPMGQRPGQRFKPGDWHCGSCSTHNFRFRVKCVQCGAAAPPQQQQQQQHREASSSSQDAAAPSGPHWTCTSCFSRNVVDPRGGAMTCPICGVPQSSSSSSSDAPTIA